MDKKTLVACLLVTSVVACVLFISVTDKYQTYVKYALDLLSVSRNLNDHHALNEPHEPEESSSVPDLISSETPPPVVSTTSRHVKSPITPSVDSKEELRLKKLREQGLESTKLHSFKSPYIIDPITYDNDTIYKVPGQRKLKIISCHNCPPMFDDDKPLNSHNKHFQHCPYSQCYFDVNGENQTQADVVLFFPFRQNLPRPLPFRPPGQIWAYCSWEPPHHYQFYLPYSEWKSVFNWSISYRTDSDLFVPSSILGWRSREQLMNDSEYLQIAKAKPKTAAWFVSNCKTWGQREEYVRRMQKILDIDIFGMCSGVQMDKPEGFQALRDTYKFYLAFENSFCKDYVTEKFFRCFSQHPHIIPVGRGAFEYQKYMPPNTVVDASQFNSPEELAEYLKDLAADPPRYAAMLKEKDKLTVLRYRYDWCELCERLHKGVKPKMIKDIKDFMGKDSVCWTPEL